MTQVAHTISQLEKVKQNPIDLGDYTDEFKKDMQEFRENLIFKHDMEHPNLPDLQNLEGLKQK